MKYLTAPHDYERCTNAPCLKLGIEHCKCSRPHWDDIHNTNEQQRKEQHNGNPTD